MVNNEIRVRSVTISVVFISLVLALLGIVFGYFSYEDNKDILNGIKTTGIVDNVYKATPTDRSTALIYYSIRVYDSHGDIDHVELSSSSFTGSFSKGDRVSLVTKRSDVNYFVSQDSVDRLKRAYKFLFLTCGIGELACIIVLFILVKYWDSVVLVSEATERSTGTYHRDYAKGYDDLSYVNRPVNQNTINRKPVRGYSRVVDDYSGRDLSSDISDVVASRRRPTETSNVRRVKVTKRQPSRLENQDDFDLFDL